MKNDIGVVKGEPLYPEKKTLFRPSKNYPEYPFQECASKNYVYEMVRECFHILKMDECNYGKEQWNPFKDMISPGNTVLLKPNLVRHINYSGAGEECLYTHPSVVAVILDYVVIALKGAGKIIVGDAPVQSCNFDILIHESGYLELIEYYQSKGIDICLMDFRNFETDLEDNILIPQKNTVDKKEHGIVVNLGRDSAFYGQDINREKDYRVTCYDPDELIKHHSGEKHEYKINRAILEADVIINIPKPKTHRKAGITGALKNLVGICTNKEYLPHHTQKSKQEGGDEYERKNELIAIATEILDIKNKLMVRGEYEEAKQLDALHKGLLTKGKIMNAEFYSEGSWFGNDTIWRTISDLNKIVLYADKNGIMQEQKQRRIFHVGDMIISGHKEGPLLPAPLKAGMIVMAEDPVLFDRVVCKLMGFRYQDIPSIENEDIYITKYPYYSGKKENIVSKPELFSDDGLWKLKFIPSKGWEMLLGNPYKDEIIDNIKRENLAVYVWGAGISGMQSAEYLKRREVEIKQFFDNDPAKDGTVVWDGVFCGLPKEIMEKESICIISVPEKCIEEVKKEASCMHFKCISVFE